MGLNGQTPELMIAGVGRQSVDALTASTLERQRNAHLLLAGSALWTGWLTKEVIP